MDTAPKPERLEGFFNRKTIAGALLTAGPVGVATLTPIVWPRLDYGIGVALVILFAGAILAGVGLLWSGHRQRMTETVRRWNIVGMGQGWIEARVRNDAGDQLVVSWNAGAGADAISLWTTFRKRSRPRRSAIVEMICDIDGTAFEWDVPDSGDAMISLNAVTWKDVEAVKMLIAAMREGTTLLISVPVVRLRAKFTLDGAFDVLEGAVSLGEEPAAPQD